MTVATTPAPWTVVVPVKAWHTAKSRLTGVRPADRARLARALAQDTVATVLATPQVARCLVACEDDTFEALTGTGASHVPVADGEGMCGALVVGGASAAVGGGGVCFLVADLPLLTATDLGVVLDRASTYRTSVVRDRSGDGTVLLAARDGAPHPFFGRGSGRRHVLAGATDLTGHAAPALRQDLDTDADLVSVAPTPGSALAGWATGLRAHAPLPSPDPARRSLLTTRRRPREAFC